jgi:predicted  nucleic acid-binding Zn-ribbon protein
MEQQINLLAQLAAVDAQLDELHDELGDLPQDVKKLEVALREKVTALEVTQKSIEELNHLRGTAHVTIQESLDKEQRLAQQQFQVKNNREFDAITREIEHLKTQRTEIEERLRTSGVREENLKTTLAQQEQEVATVREKLTEKASELEERSGGQNDELKKYIDVRLRLSGQIDDALEAEYERIRTFHNNAAVAIKRNSCSGCYSAIPSQRIMEMKYQRDKVYTCEGCGRILFTEDVEADIDTLMAGA